AVMIALNIPVETVIFGDAATVNLGHAERSRSISMCELGGFRSVGCAQHDAVVRTQDDAVVRTQDDAVVRTQNHGLGSPYFTSTLEALS
ncbi:MAG: hypothetical protein ACJARN_001167, partial [Arenicella sp.]